MSKDIKMITNKEVEELAQKILKHKKLYYKGNKEIEDEEFDQLEKELKRLNPTHPVLEMVGSIFFGSEAIPHEKKMLSLEKSYEKDDIHKFREKSVLFATFKVDGSSCSLIYENGILKLAKTRGDGLFGENISVAASYIPSIPKNIKIKIKSEIRGEIYCTNENFSKLSLEMEKRGLDKPKSLRNITAGLLGRKENQDLCKFLNFFAFELMGEEFETEHEKQQRLIDLKFELPENSVITTAEELDSFIETTFQFMNNGNYQIDGVVFTHDSISMQKSLGETKHHPRYKIAFKFEGEVKETKILRIEWQISRFGIYTPVAILEPVDIKGAVINKVTLHHRQMVEALNLKKDDVIKIIRSGEVIPKIIGVVTSSKNKLDLPTHCAYCKNILKQDEIRLFCDNLDCSGRKLEDIIQFVKKINIEDLSEKRIEMLINNNLIKNTADIFRLTTESLLTLDGFKHKLASKIIKNIENSKSLSVIAFFDALGFTGGAKNKVELILQNFKIKSIQDFFKLTEAQLNEVKGFGEKGSKDFLNSLQNKKELIKELTEECGLIISIPKLIESDLLNGQIYCITGETSIPRKELEKIIKSNGGKATSSVSKNLNFLICNEDSNSSKYKKAQELGVEVISENQFKEKFKIKY